MRFLSKDGGARDLTYGELRDLTNRFANVLRELGVGKGERVFSLLGRVPELYVAMLALPRTPSGKVMRRLLKAREVGPPESDGPSLEEDA